MHVMVDAFPLDQHPPSLLNILARGEGVLEGAASESMTGKAARRDDLMAGRAMRHASNRRQRMWHGRRDDSGKR